MTLNDKIEDNIFVWENPKKNQKYSKMKIQNWNSVKTPPNWMQKQIVGVDCVGKGLFVGNGVKIKVV
jgi:hypothetical protein